MKHVVFGMITGVMLIYVIAIGISLFSISSHRNELDNALSQEMETVMRTYYQNGESGNASDKAKEEIERLLRGRITSDSKVEVLVITCDMELGILTVKMTSHFPLPNGKMTKVEKEKTLIVENGD